MKGLTYDMIMTVQSSLFYHQICHVNSNLQLRVDGEDFLSPGLSWTSSRTFMTAGTGLTLSSSLCLMSSSLSETMKGLTYDMIMTVQLSQIYDQICQVILNLHLRVRGEDSVLQVHHGQVHVPVRRVELAQLRCHRHVLCQALCLRQ